MTNETNFSGNINVGGNANFGSGTQNNSGNVTNNQFNAPSGSNKDIMMQLQALIDQLNAALNDVPTEHKEPAQKVAKRVEQLMEEVATEEPDAEVIESKVSLLQKAADDIKAVLPTVAQIAFQIVAYAAKVS